MIVVVCPGQGSQTPGFLAPWLSEPLFADRIAQLSDSAGLDLARHGTDSDADTIRDTAIAQPLIVAAGVLALDGLIGGGVADRVGGIAGHSVGEITAAIGSGVLSAGEGMRFVGERGRAMADAAAAVETGMSAVVGGAEQAVLDRLAELELFPANYNGGGQIVVAGTTSALESLRAAPPAGARVVPLQVAGAFHTRYMAPAVDRLAEVARTLTPTDPELPLWSNRDGSVVESGAQFVDLLVGQVSSPVRWDLCMSSFADRGVTGLIELAPAGALVGLAKRGLRGIPSVALKSPDELPAAIAMLTASA